MKFNIGDKVTEKEDNRAFYNTGYGIIESFSIAYIFVRFPYDNTNTIWNYKEDELKLYDSIKIPEYFKEL